MVELAKVNQAPQERVRARWSAWPVLALLAALLVAHIGCHGDEDNELFLRSGQWPVVSGQLKTQVVSPPAPGTPIADRLTTGN